MQRLRELFEWFDQWVEGTDGISEETMEEYRMLSGFKQKEIVRLHRIFHEVTANQDKITKEQFLAIPAVIHNPLKERIAMCFGFDEEKNSLDFQGFLSGMSLFNSPGQRETKLKTMFRIQDFDNDDAINKNDLIQYLKLVVGENMEQSDMETVAGKVLEETSTDPRQEFLSLSDYQRVVAKLDFQAKMLIPI